MLTHFYKKGNTPFFEIEKYSEIMKKYAKSIAMKMRICYNKMSFAIMIQNERIL